MKHDAIRKAFERDQKIPELKKPNIGGRRKKNKPAPHAQGSGPNNKYLTYEQAKIFVAAAEYITSSTEYKEWVRIKKYKFLPLTPTYTYRKEWEGWLRFLGAEDRIPTSRRLPYYEAKSIAQELSAKHNLTEGDCFKNWVNFCDEQYILPEEERELPPGVPRYPHGYYDEWEGWPAWVGKGLRSKIEQAQVKDRLVAESRDQEITKYNGQPVYAITTGVDPMNSNVIKVIVDHTGLSSLIASCNSLQYDILTVYIFDRQRAEVILDNLNSYGTDKGDSCYVVHNMPALLSGLEFDTQKLPAHLYS